MYDTDSVLENWACALCPGLPFVATDGNDGRRCRATVADNTSGRWVTVHQNLVLVPGATRRLRRPAPGCTRRTAAGVGPASPSFKLVEPFRAVLSGKAVGVPSGAYMPQNGCFAPLESISYKAKITGQLILLGPCAFGAAWRPVSIGKAC
jgi:hypothetical protein